MYTICDTFYSMFLNNALLLQICQFWCFLFLGDNVQQFFFRVVSLCFDGAVLRELESTSSKQQIGNNLISVYSYNVSSSKIFKASLTLYWCFCVFTVDNSIFVGVFMWILRPMFLFVFRSGWPKDNRSVWKESEKNIMLYLSAFGFHVRTFVVD